MLRWPDVGTVEAALRRWVRKVARRRKDILRIGYFGSYARGEWGVGSDLDLVIVVESSALPFEQRSAEWDTTGLPVPTDVLVYTSQEWEARPPKARFTRTLARETVWLYEKAPLEGATG